MADYDVDNYVPDEPIGYVPSNTASGYYDIDDPANYPRSETNPGGYDPRASYNQPLSGLTSILGQFKGVFDRLKSGNTTTADVNAALGILGLLMPSLTAPKTAGWKGSIDLNRQFTRTPKADPAALYKPYSGQPVMGRQYFTSAYGTPSATAPTEPTTAPPPVEQATAALPASQNMGDATEVLTQALAEPPSAAPVVEPVIATAAPIAAPVAAPVAAPTVNTGIAKILAQAAAPVAAPVSAPTVVRSAAPDLSKYSAWEGYLTNPAFDKPQWLNALNRAYNQPGMNLWGVQNISAPEMEQYLKSKNVLTSQDIASIRPQPQPAPALAYGDFEGKGEYFTPEGQYRQFTSTGTPIAPQRYGPQMGELTGKVISPYSIGEQAAGFKFMNPPVNAAEGGLMSLAQGGPTGEPRYLRGKTDGMADELNTSIDGVQPAKLSHGEFVMPADVVAHLGNGNNEAGAEVLYNMMDRVRMARTGTKKQGKQINPEKFMPGGIAGYAGGGAVAFQTGGAAPPPPTAPLGTSTETNISSWAGPYVGDMLSKTAALTNAPYQAYTGPLSAGYSPLQQKMFTGLESLSFPGQLGQTFTAAGAPMLPTAATTGPMQTVGATGIASQYMNPYLNAVLQPQLEEMRRQAQISQTGISAKFGGAGGAGAFSAPGGARQTLAEAELQRNLLGEMNKAIGTGYASAYDKALQQFNTEQGQAKTLAEMMAGAGAQQRGIEQEGISEARKQFETEQLKPYTDLRFQREMISGLPVATTATTANTSTMGQFAGGFEQLAKALKELGVG